MSRFDEILSVYLRDLSTAVGGSEMIKVNEEFKKLNKLENQFAKALRSFKEGRQVYKDFTYMINVIDGSLRGAHSYFRERESTRAEINKAIGRVDLKTLYKIPINHKFCKFAVDKLKASRSSAPQIEKLNNIFSEILNSRNKVINTQLHVALNRAKVFNSRNTQALLEFSDYVQIANEGLVSAVDKFVLQEDGSPFHEMAFGKIVANLIYWAGNASMVSIGAGPQKKLYKIRKELSKNYQASAADLSRILSIAESEINELMSASRVSYYHSDSKSGDKTGPDGNVEMYEIDDENFTIDESAEQKLSNRQTALILLKLFDRLSLLQKKILILKGMVPYDEIKMEVKNNEHES